MNKQEAIKKIEKEKSNLNAWEDLTRNRALNDALAIVRKINEPEKAAVPKFVAEWIETHKRCMPFLSHLFTDNLDEELKEWLDFSDNQNLMAKAWMYGYEIEQEKLYTVEIPDPNSYCNYRYLSRNDNGICIDASNDTKWKQKKRNQFTESEIKEDFEWAWQWAKPVEEE